MSMSGSILWGVNIIVTSPATLFCIHGKCCCCAFINSFIYQFFSLSLSGELFQSQRDRCGTVSSRNLRSCLQLIGERHKHFEMVCENFSTKFEQKCFNISLYI